MATADNVGMEISYEITGEGTPVVLLHGSLIRDASGVIRCQP
jgi:hypothetical protein